MGCKKVAASNVESVFSGAGKFTEEAKLTGPVLLQRIVKLHYNFKYKFLRPPMNAITTCYNKKHGHEHNKANPVPPAPGQPGSSATPLS